MLYSDPKPNLWRIHSPLLQTPLTPLCKLRVKKTFCPSSRLQTFAKPTSLIKLRSHSCLSAEHLSQSNHQARRRSLQRRRRWATRTPSRRKAPTQTSRPERKRCGSTEPQVKYHLTFPHIMMMMLWLLPFPNSMHYSFFCNHTQYQMYIH